MSAMAEGIPETEVFMDEMLAKGISAYTRVRIITYLN
jgi:hypothetical protein